MILLNPSCLSPFSKKDSGNRYSWLHRVVVSKIVGPSDDTHPRTSDASRRRCNNVLSSLSLWPLARLLNFSIFPMRDLERNRITAREWLFRYRVVDRGWRQPRRQPPRERERSAARLIYISRELSARLSIFQGAPTRAIRGRAPVPAGLWISTNFLPIFVWRERFNRPGAWVQSVIRGERSFFVRSRISSSVPLLALILVLLLYVEKNARG